MMTTKRVATVLAVLAGVSAAGCFAQGEAFKRIPPGNRTAVVYVYRPYHVTGSADDPMVTCGHDTIAIRSGGYHPFIADPGTITCTTDAGARVSFEVRPEQEYFVREEVAMKLGPDTPSLVKVSHGDGMDQISSCVRD
jgi:hypothetical protein